MGIVLNYEFSCLAIKRTTSSSAVLKSEIISFQDSKTMRLWYVLVYRKGKGGDVNARFEKKRPLIPNLYPLIKP